MSTVNQVSLGVSIPYIVNTSIEEIGEKLFFQKFWSENVKLIGTDEKAYSDEESITSYDIGDCITIFAIEKVNNETKGIIGWHIANETTVEDIKGEDYLEDYIDSGESENSEGLEESEEKSESTDVNNSKTHYELFIIGGDENTTIGERCLLQNIHQAIDEFFIKDNFVIVREMVNLNKGTKYQFVSANLQMNGILTFCLHNTRHY